MIDSFYRAVLIPASLFDKFTTLINISFNQSGPASGMVFCSSAANQGNCWVQNAKCADVRSGFRDVMIELSDGIAYAISPDNYLSD